MVGSPARTDEESSRQQQANRIAIEEDGADSNNPPPAFATRDLLRPVGRAIVSIRVISRPQLVNNSLISCQRVLFFFFVVCNHNFTYPLGSAEISEKYPRRDITNSYVVMCHISVTSKSHH